MRIVEKIFHYLKELGGIHGGIVALLAIVGIVGGFKFTSIEDHLAESEECLRRAYAFHDSGVSGKAASEFKCAVKHLTTAVSEGDGKAASKLATIYAQLELSETLSIRPDEMMQKSVEYWCIGHRLESIRSLTPTAMRALNPDFPRDPPC